MKTVYLKQFNPFYILMFTVLFVQCKTDTNKLNNTVPFSRKISNEQKKIQVESLTKHLGEKFILDSLIDVNGNPGVIDCSKADITIVDCWFNDCPPCVEEMAQFKNLLDGKDKSVQVYSISVSSNKEWKLAFAKSSGRFAFLADHLSNWHHYNLMSADDSSLHNTVSIDRQQELKQKLDVTFFPGYFVLNKAGIIQSRPASAVAYLKGL